MPASVPGQFEHLRARQPHSSNYSKGNRDHSGRKVPGSCPQHQILSQHCFGSAWFPGKPAAYSRPRDVRANMKKTVQGAGEHTRQTDGSKQATSLSLPQDDSFEEERGEWL